MLGEAGGPYIPVTLIFCGAKETNETRLFPHLNFETTEKASQYRYACQVIGNLNHTYHFFVNVSTLEKGRL